MCEIDSRAAEAELLRRAKAGEASAFDELVTLHRQRVFMQAYLITRNEDDAMDLSQDTFLRAWKNLSHFDGKFPVAAWLRRIVTNAAIDLCRSKQRRPQVELDDVAMTPDAASRTTPTTFETPGDGIDRAEIGRRIEAAFLELTPDHRAVIALKEFDDLSYQEIAEAVGCSVGTVMSRLFYARKKLQSLLSDLRHA